MIRDGKKEALNDTSRFLRQFEPRAQETRPKTKSAVQIGAW
jgi:hypothetical protein